MEETTSKAFSVISLWLTDTDQAPFSFAIFMPVSKPTYPTKTVPLYWVTPPLNSKKKKVIRNDITSAIYKKDLGEFGNESKKCVFFCIQI